ncbi:hypothetical protein OG21DRAFT_1284191 [Imleria badia]|nr:hypothetical protein OG21DRAFT_1284191 [Imleria badia]
MHPSHVVECPFPRRYPLFVPILLFQWMAHCEPSHFFYFHPLRWPDLSAKSATQVTYKSDPRKRVTLSDLCRAFVTS